MKLRHHLRHLSVIILVIGWCQYAADQITRDAKISFWIEEIRARLGL